MRLGAALSPPPRSGIERRRVFNLAVIVVGAENKWKSGKTLGIPRLGAIERVVEKFCRNYASFPHDESGKKF
jgi:hypothetical protein